MEFGKLTLKIQDYAVQRDNAQRTDGVVHLQRQAVTLLDYTMSLKILNMEKIA
jgi:hypothetical protein